MKITLCVLLTVALTFVVMAKPSHRCQEKKAKDDAVFAIIVMNMSEYDLVKTVYVSILLFFALFVGTLLPATPH